MNDIPMTFTEASQLISVSRRNGFKWGVLVTIGVQLLYKAYHQKFESIKTPFDIINKRSD